MYSESKRVEYLDSIRGLAALFVLLAHICSVFVWPAKYYALMGLPFISILSDGKGAVCMFFVLSGFVLSKPYVPSAENPCPRKIFLPTFYLRRLVRIWLPWFFVFVVSIIARDFLFYQPETNPPVTNWLNHFWHEDLTVGSFFRQCAFLEHDVNRQLLNQDWSLGVELKGSALIPLFIFLLARKRIVFLLILAVVLPVSWRTGHYYVSFIIGVLLSRHGDNIISLLHQSTRLIRAIILILGLLLYQAINFIANHCHGSELLGREAWVASSLGCALVLASSFGSQSIQKCLSCKPILFLGRVSYSLYLLQFVVILCLLQPLVWLLNNFGVSNYPVLFGITILTSVAVTVACSAITYRLIELPAINLGHHLTRKIQERLQK